MLHKCGHFTQKDKDTGGTMRERINRLARGIIDNGSPELVLAPERVEASVPAGEVIRGEILVSSGNNLHIKGLVYSSHERVRVVNSAFGGLRNRIIYEVNVGFSEHGDEIKGSFYLVTNGGEREIPYSLRIQAGSAGETLDALAAPDDFGKLAKRDLDRALQLFEYQDFVEAPFMQDARCRTLYDGLKGRPGRRNLLEEFLVALGVKEPVELSVDTEGRVYENPLDQRLGLCVGRFGGGRALYPAGDETDHGPGFHGGALQRGVPHPAAVSAPRKEFRPDPDYLPKGDLHHPHRGGGGRHGGHHPPGPGGGQAHGQGQPAALSLPALRL